MFLVSWTDPAERKRKIQEESNGGRPTGVSTGLRVEDPDQRIPKEIIERFGPVDRACGTCVTGVRARRTFGTRAFCARVLAPILSLGK